MCWMLSITAAMARVEVEAPPCVELARREEDEPNSREEDEARGQGDNEQRGLVKDA